VVAAAACDKSPVCQPIGSVVAAASERSLEPIRRIVRPAKFDPASGSSFVRGIIAENTYPVACADIRVGKNIVGGRCALCRCWRFEARVRFPSTSGLGVFKTAQVQPASGFIVVGELVTRRGGLQAHAPDSTRPPASGTGSRPTSSFAKYTCGSPTGRRAVGRPGRNSLWGGSTWKFWQDARQRLRPGSQAATSNRTSSMARRPIPGLRRRRGAGTASAHRPGAGLAGSHGRQRRRVGKNTDGGRGLRGRPSCEPGDDLQTAPAPAGATGTRCGGHLAGARKRHEHDGRMEAFARGTDGALWHAVQGLANGKIRRLGHAGGAITGNPAVAADSDGSTRGITRWAAAAPSTTAGRTKPNGAGEMGEDRRRARRGDKGHRAPRNDGHMGASWRGVGRVDTWRPNGRAASPRGRSLGASPPLSRALRRAQRRRPHRGFVRGTDGHLYHDWETNRRRLMDGWFDGGGPARALRGQRTRTVVIRGLSPSTDGTPHPPRRHPNSSLEGWVKLGGAMNAARSRPEPGRAARGLLPRHRKTPRSTKSGEGRPRHWLAQRR